MTLKTISFALIETGQANSRGALAYAPRLAARFGAGIEAMIAVPPLLVPSLAYSGYAVATQMMMFVERENAVRTQQAQATADVLRETSSALGVEARVSVLSALYDPPNAPMLRMARVSDICVVSAPGVADSWSHDILVDLLFGAGTPLLLVPEEWETGAGLRSAVVAWDGGRAAARAIRDALPLLAEFESIEIVGVEGEKDIGAEFAADLQLHLQRHCRRVSTKLLPMIKGGVAATLAAHARSAQADLLVMGAYGHSRLREFILGGATREMVTQVALPTLMSH